MDILEYYHERQYTHPEIHAITWLRQCHEIFNYIDAEYIDEFIEKNLIALHDLHEELGPDKDEILKMSATTNSQSA